MSTIEKLIVQIFDRKSSIIEQVRHQVELYDQQLACKLVIQGIDPPEWLWSHQAPSQSSDPSEIDKQRLISELLLPVPQHAVPYFSSLNFDSLSIPECNFDQQDEGVDLKCYDDICEVPDVFTEVENVASSPQQQVATRLDDGEGGIDLSCVEFTRSKSRQRAVEVRSSAKSGATRNVQSGSISAVCYRNGTPGVEEFVKSNCLEKPDSGGYLNIQLDDNAKCEGLSTSCFSEHTASKEYENISVSNDPACIQAELVGAVFCEQVNEPMQSKDTLNVVREGDTESAGIEIQSCNMYKSSGSMPTQDLHHIESVGRMCDRKSFVAVSDRQINISSRSPDDSSICHKGDSEPGGINIRWSKKGNNSSEEITKEGLKIVEQGHALSSNSLHYHPQLLEMSNPEIPCFHGDKNYGMLKEQTEDNPGREKHVGEFSSNLVRLEGSLQKNPELFPAFPDGESDDGISGMSSSCNLSQSNDSFLQSLQSESPAIIIGSTKGESEDCLSRQNRLFSSGVKSSELHTSSCYLEGGNSLLEEPKVLTTEAEIPQLQSETAGQPYLQKEDANVTACGYPPLNDGVLHEQDVQLRDLSVSCCVDSKAFEDSYPMQDKTGAEEKLRSEVTPSLLKATIPSFSKILSKGETKSLRISSYEPIIATDDNTMNENRSDSFLEENHLPLDLEAKLNEEQCEDEILSIKSGLEIESYATGFEESAYVMAKNDGMMDTNESMPVLEGFFMDTDDGESFFTGGQDDIEESCFPGSILRRVSALERLYQSSSRNTPVSQFPMTYGLQKTSDLFQSVPTGLLEHISLSGDSNNMKLQNKSFSAGLPLSTGFHVSTPYASPFKKKWDHSTSSSGIRSGGSLNPELVCFTIEEDPGNCDDGNHDEATEAPPCHGSGLESSLKRKPLADITEDGKNLHLSLSVNKKDVFEAGQPKFCIKSQLDSTCTEADLTGSQTRTSQKLGKKLSNKKRRLNYAKENRNVSVGANGVKPVTDSLKEIKSQKPKYSENLKTTTGVSDQQKGLRSNNIVSNVSSFIPLVQKKKEAAVITGKRDVKVKALEAAEAAKRLAEKKENERRAKKEASKAEKARLEQEKLLQLELKKKKKEEELKQKEAEVVVRKRIRDEEAKKENEGKRRRVEEARKQQHEQAKKQAEKLIRNQADGLRIHKNDPDNGVEQCTKMDGEGKCRVTAESGDKLTTMPTYTRTMLHDLKDCNTNMKAGTSNSNLNMAVSDLNATAQKDPKDMEEVQQSYDISPYQGSDDDDEDGNDIRKHKFIPAWASKHSLAEAIFSQQHINPDEVLPPESFCSIAEVLVPRKLLAK